jgi:SAM-dependent methyltransferase
MSLFGFTWKAALAASGRRRSRRTPQFVRATYDAVRGRIRVSDFDTFVFGKSGGHRIALNDGHVQWQSHAEIVRTLRHHVVATVARACRGIANPVVVEAGAGSGANLLLLKKLHPEIHAIGLELSPVSVELARAAAESFGLHVEMREADLTQSLPDLAQPVDVCFSCHALEQMPDVFPAAVDNMLGLAQSEVILFEPVGELYGRGLRQTVARLRLRAVDYLSGLYDYLVARRAAVTYWKALGIGTSPFNETVEIHVRTRPALASTALRPAHTR